MNRNDPALRALGHLYAIVVFAVVAVAVFVLVYNTGKAACQPLVWEDGSITGCDGRVFDPDTKEWRDPYRF